MLTEYQRSERSCAVYAGHIKGVQYAFFSAAGGAYTATYAADTTPPTVTLTTPAGGATGVNQSTIVTATFSEPNGPSYDYTDHGRAYAMPLMHSYQLRSLTTPRRVGDGHAKQSA